MTTLQTVTISKGEAPPPTYNKNAKSAHVVRLSAKQKQKSINLQRWSCPECTLLNTIGRNQCKACGHQRLQITPLTPTTPTTPSLSRPNSGPTLAKRTSSNRSIEIDQSELMRNDYDMFNNIDINGTIKYIMYICCILSILSFIGLIVIMFININNQSIELLVISGGSICCVIAVCICVIRLALNKQDQRQKSKGNSLPNLSPSPDVIDSLPSFSN